MRTAEELEAMKHHPSWAPVSDASGAVPVVGSPYRSFFEALEDLEENVLLYGRGSVEARIARDRVNRTRELAAEAWRKEQAAA